MLQLFQILGWISEPMAAVIMRWRSIVYLLGSLLMLVVYNEWLVYYMVLLQCQWPQLDGSNEDFSILESSSEPSRVVLLADTHLLGTREGHWFDKLRRFVGAVETQLLTRVSIFLEFFHVNVYRTLIIQNVKKFQNS